MQGRATMIVTSLNKVLCSSCTSVRSADTRYARVRRDVGNYAAAITCHPSSSCASISLCFCSVLNPINYKIWAKGCPTCQANGGGHVLKSSCRLRFPSKLTQCSAFQPCEEYMQSNNADLASSNKSSNSVAVDCGMNGQRNEMWTAEELNTTLPSLDVMAQALDRAGQSHTEGTDIYHRRDATVFREQRRNRGMTRRLVLSLLVATQPTLVSTAVVTPTGERSLGNSLLRSLGIGDADIYYPRFFVGTWSCYSTLIAVDTPQGEDKADRKSLEFSRKQLGFTVEYQARFMPFQANVIGDRFFTTYSLVESTVGKDVVQSGIWTPEKPNRLTLILRGGLKVCILLTDTDDNVESSIYPLQTLGVQVENLVTKRSSEITGPGQFDTSEFSKQVFDNSSIKDGPPSVKASQNLTRYRWDPTEDPVSVIEAFQRVAMFPLPGEGMDVMDVMGMDKPITVYKYLVRFTRQTGSLIAPGSVRKF